jgi:NAD(P)-dependent dehydrogenase (short-subunit alcohol dehydrogenase family)
VTGSSSGIGAAAAQKLAGRGCNVVVNYSRGKADAEEIVAECEALGVEAVACQADVSNDADCRRMAAVAAERWGRIDVLINSAGTTKRVPHADLEGLSAEDFQRIYAVNAIGPFQMVRAVAPTMRESGGGAVVNISAGAGFHGGGSSVAYAASKAALNAMTLLDDQADGRGGVRGPCRAFARTVSAAPDEHGGRRGRNRDVADRARRHHDRRADQHGCRRAPLVRLGITRHLIVWRG